MNPLLFKTLIPLLPALVLLCGAIVLWHREKTVLAFMQLFGAGCLTIVVLTHICEAIHLFSIMNWGLENSAGHYIDLAGAIGGLTLFPVGYVLHALFPAQRAGIDWPVSPDSTHYEN